MDVSVRLCTGLYSTHYMVLCLCAGRVGGGNALIVGEEGIFTQQIDKNGSVNLQEKRGIALLFIRHSARQPS
jgi:hypothetical protein